MGAPSKQSVQQRWSRGRKLAVALAACVVAVACGVAIASCGNPAQEDSSAAAGSISAAANQTAVERSASADAAAPSESSDAVEASLPARTPDGEIVPEQAIPEIAAEHEDDVVLVMLAPGYSAEELTHAIDASGCTVPQDITDDDVAAGFVTLTVAEGYDVAHAMTQLQMLPELEGAQPNYEYHLADDGLATQGGAADLKMRLAGLGLTSSSATGAALLAQALSIDDPDASKQWALDSIHAYDAWDVSKAEGAVTIAVVDNGCLVDHEDLAGNIVATYNAVDKSTNVTPFGKHGTHVAGIAAAVANNGKGVAGVSYNAGLLPIQVFTTSASAYTSSIVAAYNYIMENAAAYRIKVVNMSVGITIAGESMEDVDLASDDIALIKSVNDAYEAGVLTVCSAGNDAVKQGGPYINYPSDWLDNALAVISLQNGTPPTRAASSNYNMPGQTTKDISAPGASIYSTVTDSAQSYAYDSGTSMASPCVAGVAALVFAANPDRTAAQVSDTLCNTATDLGDAGWDEVYGAGEVDAEAAANWVAPAMDGDSSMLAGQSVQLSLSRPGAWVWESSDPSAATVSEDGVVRGVAAGTATITAKLDGVVVKKTITVYSISISGGNQVEYGSLLPLSFEAAPAGGVWDIDSSDGSVAHIAYDDAGRLTGVYGLGVGEAVITATNAANGRLSVSHPVAVVPCLLDSASVKITWPNAMSFMYTGEPIAPRPDSVELTDAAGQTRELEVGVDYELAYEDNIEVGEGAVTITGLGNFGGSVSKTFRIAPKSIAGARIEGPAETTYTGSVIEPSIAVVLDDETLLEGKDYSVTYANNLDAGTASITVTGEGAYAGTLMSTFEIAQAKVGAPKAVTGLVYSGALQAGLIADPDAPYTLSGTIEAIDAGVYRVQAVLEDTANYEWDDATTAPRTLTWSIAPKRISPALSFSSDSLTYNGSDQHPTAVVADEDTVLAPSDYVLTWPSDCVDAGAYAVRVSCRGNYEGETSSAFKIVRASIADAFAGGVPVYRYRTGSFIEPTVKVSLGGVRLKGGTDYSVSYSANKKVGTAKITVRGIGNYSGKTQRTFQIIKRPVYAGATRMPVKATATWTLKNCTLKVLSGAGVVKVSGNVVYAKKAGKAVLGIYNDAGKRVAKKTVRAYKLAGKTRTIALAANTGYVLDVMGASTANGANIYLYHVNGTKAQDFRFTLLGDGTYVLKNPNSGRLVTVDGRSRANGANICQRTAKKTAYQRWRITVDAKNRLTFVSKASGKALDLKGGKVVDCRSVRQYKLTGKASQKWVLL